MKDFLGFLKDYGIKPIIDAAGTFSLTMLALCFIPSLNFIPKMFMLYILTPFIFGR